MAIRPPRPPSSAQPPFLGPQPSLIRRVTPLLLAPPLVKWPAWFPKHTAPVPALLRQVQGVPRFSLQPYLPPSPQHWPPSPARENCLSFLTCCSLFFFCCLGPHPRPMEVPRPGGESELQPPAYTSVTATQDPSRVCDLHHKSGQCRILTPLSKTRDRTRHLMDPSRVRFHCAASGAPLDLSSHPPHVAFPAPLRLTLTVNNESNYP